VETVPEVWSDTAGNGILSAQNWDWVVVQNVHDLRSSTEQAQTEERKVIMGRNAEAEHQRAIEIGEERGITNVPETWRLATYEAKASQRANRTKKKRTKAERKRRQRDRKRNRGRK